MGFMKTNLLPAAVLALCGAAFLFSVRGSLMRYRRDGRVSLLWGWGVFRRPWTVYPIIALVLLIGVVAVVMSVVYLVVGASIEGR